VRLTDRNLPLSMRDTPATLEELVAPLTETAFLELLRDRKLTLLKGARADRYVALMNWDLLLRMIERGEHPRSLTEFKIARESAMVPPEHWLTPGAPGEGNKVDAKKVAAYLAHGFSLIVTPIEPYVPHLAVLCDRLRARLNEQIKVGVIVTTGKGGAFKLHYDPEDLIILQVEGSKRWKIYGPAVPSPVIGMKPPEPPPEDVPVFDEVLEAGDFLFVPGGNWHHCENGPGRSLHLGIFFQPPTAWHAIKAATADLVADETFRTPLTRLDDAEALAKLEAAFKARAIETIERMELGKFFAEWSRAKGG
jgi:hypothetical protein